MKKRFLVVLVVIGSCLDNPNAWDIQYNFPGNGNPNPPVKLP